MRCELVIRTVALLAALLIAGRLPASVPEEDPAPVAGPTMVLVVGAPGTEEYGRSFADWADRWADAAALGETPVTVIGRDDDGAISDRQRLSDVIARERERSPGELWLVLIGHGTYDGRQANFNLRGEDVAAGELASWLEGCGRPLAIINCSSSSAPFINRLAGPNRVVVTATRSGAEQNYARFGDYLSQAVSDLSADLDKDGQVSLLESFLHASRQTQSYYEGQRQLATEHALLDDNGDARGVQADFFTGLQPTSEAAGGEALDGQRAHQWHLVPSQAERRLPPDVRRRRNELELKLAALREQKSEMDEDAYYEQIEPLLVEIARLYASAESIEESPAEDEPPSSGASESDDDMTSAEPSASGF